MYFEEYGDKSKPIIVFLHGAFFVHAFGRQYPLSDKYYLVVPHIMGFGSDSDRIFDEDRFVSELAEFIGGLKRKVTVIGFSLGAQLAVKLAAEHAELLNGAIFVSPWLIKESAVLSEALAVNLKHYKSSRKRWFCALLGLMNGLPKAQRKVFVEQMQRLREETVCAMVNNKITIDTVGGLRGADIPMLALAGEKEPDSMKESIFALEKLNPRCRAEVWEKAAHNIPPMFYKRFNEEICEFMKKIK